MLAKQIRGKFVMETENIDFAKGNGLVPVIVQDYQSREVLMVAYMNEPSLRLTLALGEAVYYSRSRQELWHKGATSGNVQKVIEILTDCDQDALVLRVNQTGEGACHTGNRSCFYRRVKPGATEHVDLEPVIASPAHDPQTVYGKRPQ